MSENQSLNGISGFPRSAEVTKRLLDLIDRCNYQLVQENGQRRLTSAGTEPRIKGAEIFLGRLPRDCYEDELVPLLSRIGRVVELRLMMDFSGSTRGYAFASFENSRIARRACDELNGYEIRDGHKIGVVKSIDNCRLFLGGVPKDKTRADFMQELGKMLDGITNIYVYPSTEDKTLNRGFVFVEFRDHRSAAMARRKLIPGRVMLWDHEVAVDWADPEPGQDIDEEIMETVSALFVRNLSLTAGESEIRNTIQRITGVQIMKIKKINHFAFLHYETRAQAQRVLDIMRHSHVSEEISEWEFTWAKPIRKSEKLQERLRCTKSGCQNQNQRQYDNREVHVGQDQNRKGQSHLSQKDKKKRITNGTTSVGVECNNNYDRKNRSTSPDSVGVSSTTSNTMPNQNIMTLINDSKTVDSHNPIPMSLLTTVIDENQRYYNHPIYNNDSTATCAKALAELAAIQFHANLRYAYWTDATMTQYFCKIILERNGGELMSYQGNPAATVNEAVQFTVQNAYLALQSMLMHGVKYN